MAGLAHLDAYLVSLGPNTVGVLEVFLKGVLNTLCNIRQE